jgi:hypothetical protein
MGTNYYHHEKPPCPTCGHAEETRHIGKSSAGWCFSLHIYPDAGIDNLAAWEARWSSGVIKNEYGDTITPERMRQAITERGPGRSNDHPYGYADWEQFHAMNRSQSGPNGLLRHQIDERHCIGHGEGTWDLIVGEFS